jgi:uncharacterized protein
VFKPCRILIRETIEMRSRAAAVLAVVVLSTAGSAAADGDLRLAAAAERRDLVAVRTLLGERIDPNASQADGTTALHWAAHWNSTETADLLVRAGAQVNAATDLGVTPLWLACTNGSGEMVDLLLKAGANAAAALPSGETILMACARTGNTPAVTALLARGARPNLVERERAQTALMWAIAAQHPAVVELLIRHGADVNARSTGGFTPLLFAAREGDIESARILIESGAAIDETSTEGESPLLVAAASLVAVSAMDYRLVPSASGHEGLAILLLERGADPRRADRFGQTALHLAVETGKVDLVRALLRGGADPNARIAKPLPFRRGDYVSRGGHNGASPFWIAAMDADLEMMRVLLEGGADPKLPSANQTSPLMVAAGLGQTDSRMPPQDRMLEAVRFALELDGNVNAANAAGQTAVHGAASVSADAIIQFLFERGARVDAKDRQGRTPYDLTQSTLRPRPATAALLRRLAQEAVVLNR